MTKRSLPKPQVGYITKDGKGKLYLCGCRGTLSRGNSRRAGKGDGDAGLQRRSATGRQGADAGTGTGLAVAVPDGSTLSWREHPERSQTPQKQSCKHPDDKLSLLCLSYSYDHSAMCVTVTGAHGHLPARFLARGECSCAWFILDLPQ